MNIMLAPARLDLTDRLSLAQQSMPARIRDLDLAPGATTTRHVVTCVADPDHNVIVDSHAREDLALRDNVHDDVLGYHFCDQCGRDGDVEASPVVIANAEALAAVVQAMTSELAMVKTFLASPPSPLVACVCDSCGSRDVRLDAYSVYIPLTNEHELMSAMDDGHECQGCNGSEIDVDDRAMSAHEGIKMLEAMRDRAASLEAELAQVQDWITVHGASFT